MTLTVTFSVSLSNEINGNKNPNNKPFASVVSVLLRVLTNYIGYVIFAL